MLLNDILIAVIYLAIITAILYVVYSFIPDEIKTYIKEKITKDDKDE